MLTWFADLNPIIQALMASLFTWGLIENARQAAVNATALTVHLSTDEVASLDAATAGWRPRV